MKIDVYDTYATSQSGKTLHFDVFLPQGQNLDQAAALGHARAFLKSIGEPTDAVASTRCNFCHSEIADPAVEKAIGEQGHYILQMEGCPSPRF